MDGGRIGLSSALWRSFRNGDFEEEDVWHVLNDKSTTTSETFDHSKFSSDSYVFESDFLPSASRMIPRPNGGGYTQIVPRSAPRSIPQWFKREGSRNPRTVGLEQDDEDGVDGDGGDGSDSAEEDEEEEGFDNRVPPHELIAKRLARAQISSFSVFEGVGRTLKGRDLSKVRNAVLNKTGFLESL
ncbi:uncharacterized protein LOC120086282 [Benincasa hispida]|uniref:uncharacterized protein LOC120086282 n=1 Tax=Benincasa hispida TaxID=102211 RepID=UPI0018FF3CED|nr:uncharacterized protein LOC120086282 [Benincasa hispida]